MTTKTFSMQKQTINNQIQTYQKNLPVSFVAQDNPQLPLPDYEILVQITKLADSIDREKLKLEQKQLLLQTTKEQYRQRLLSEEKDIRSRVVTIKKRQNIAEVVERIRQSEVELQNKILARMEQYKPTQKLSKNQKRNLFMALINKVTNVS
jgi:thymidylate kinase